MTLQAIDVTVRFGNRVVLDHLDLDLPAGAQSSLVGRSGSGKTTLLLVLAGLLPPTSGRVEHGTGDVVYVPQAPSLVPELTAEQNAAIGLRLRGVDPVTALERAREELGELGVAEAAGALPGELSGGMQQRVALARALAVRPEVLLADEPTGALDRATGARVVRILGDRAHRGGTTLVVATHDPSVAGAFGRTVDLTSEVPA